MTTRRSLSRHSRRYARYVRHALTGTPTRAAILFLFALVGGLTAFGSLCISLAAAGCVTP